MGRFNSFRKIVRPSILLAAALVPSAAFAQTTMTFSPACTAGLTPHPIASTISEGGFTLTDVPATVGAPTPSFLEWCTVSPNFAGPGAWSGGLGTSATLTESDGGLFSLLSIDLAELTPLDNDDVTLTFIGHTHGGGSVFQNFLLEAPDESNPVFSTFDFGADFTNLDSVDFARESASPQRFQFSNVVAAPVTATPEPASMGLVATGLAGLIGIARRRKAVRLRRAP